jgi:hypothetical protein
MNRSAARLQPMQIKAPGNMAERVGFEPTDPVRGQRFSRPPD